jgi:23S rRNA (adenine2503-C2)-methyltransferase
MDVLFDQEKLEIRAKEHKIPQFKVKQIFFELFKNQRVEWDEMTTLSNQLKDELKSDFSPISLKCMETVEADTTTKFAFQTEDGYTVEAILMYHWQDEKYIKNGKRKLNRITLCISSQIGCPVNCLFCVTGKLGFTRNLTWDEIISQVLYANAYVFKRFGKKED